MKATHTGRLKNIRDLIECLRLDPSGYMIAGKYLCFLNDNEGGLIKVYKEDEIWRTDEFGFSDSMLTNITPIKPKVEIPETPFWFKLNNKSGIVFKMTSEEDHYICSWIDKKGELNDTTYYDKAVYSALENKSWTICDEPKKDYQFPIFFQNSLGSIICVGGKEGCSYYTITETGKRGMTMGEQPFQQRLENDLIVDGFSKPKMRPWTDEELIEYLMTEGWFCQGSYSYYPSCIDKENELVTFVDENQDTVLQIFEYIIQHYTDRHGNKFEKEV